MSKFKVGDKVITVTNCDCTMCKLVRKNSGEITEITDDGFYEVTSYKTRRTGYFNDNDLELFETKTEQKIREKYNI